MVEKKRNEEESWESLPYEKLVEELDAVVQRLEEGELPLEESLRDFEKGVKLARAAEKQLDRAEHRVEVLLQEGKSEALPPLPESEDEGDEEIPF